MHKTETKAELTLPLDDKQAMAKATLATQTMKKLQKFDEEYGIIKREKNKERKEMNMEIGNLINDFASKTTVRDVPCMKVLDSESGDCWFEYEGGEYNRREMDDDELAESKQGQLFDESAVGAVHSEAEDNHAEPEDDVFEAANLAVVD